MLYENAVEVGPFFCLEETLETEVFINVGPIDAISVCFVIGSLRGRCCAQTRIVRKILAGFTPVISANPDGIAGQPNSFYNHSLVGFVEISIPMLRNNLGILFDN